MNVIYSEGVRIILNLFERSWNSFIFTCPIHLVWGFFFLRLNGSGVTLILKTAVYYSLYLLKDPVCLYCCSLEFWVPLKSDLCVERSTKFQFWLGKRGICKKKTVRNSYLFCLHFTLFTVTVLGTLNGIIFNLWAVLRLFLKGAVSRYQFLYVKIWPNKCS